MGPISHIISSPNQGCGFFKNKLGWVGGLGAGHSTQEGAHEDLGACLFSSFSGHQDKSFPQMNCSQDLILRYL
jgi:hypothetical protein